MLGLIARRLAAASTVMVAVGFWAAATQTKEKAKAKRRISTRHYGIAATVLPSGEVPIIGRQAAYRVSISSSTRPTDPDGASTSSMVASVAPMSFTIAEW